MRVLFAVLVAAVLAGTARAEEPVPAFDGTTARVALPEATSEAGFALDVLEGTVLSLKVKAASEDVEPEIRLFDPVDEEVPLAARIRRKSDGSRVKLRKFVLSVTGRYLLVVTSRSGVAGDLTFKVRMDHPRKFRQQGTVSLPEAQTLMRFPAFAETRARIKVKGRQGLVPGLGNVLGPNVSELALGIVQFTSTTSRKTSLTCPDWGDYRLQIGSADASTGAWRCTVKLTHPDRPGVDIEVVGSPEGTFVPEEEIPVEDPGDPGLPPGADEPVTQTEWARATLEIIDRVPPNPNDPQIPPYDPPGGKAILLGFQNLKNVPLVFECTTWSMETITVRRVSDGKVVYRSLPEGPGQPFTATIRSALTIYAGIPFTRIANPLEGEFEVSVVFNTDDPRIPRGPHIRFTAP